VELLVEVLLEVLLEVLVEVLVEVVVELLLEVLDPLTLDSGVIKVPPMSESGAKELSLKSSVVFTFWKNTGLPAAVKARPESNP